MSSKNSKNEKSNDDDLALIDIDKLVETKKNEIDKPGNKSKLKKEDKKAIKESNKLLEKVALIKKKLGKFCNEFAGLVADIIITTEKSIYQKIKNKEIESLDVSNLCDSKSEEITCVLTTFLELIFNQMAQNLHDSIVTKNKKKSDKNNTSGKNEIIIRFEKMITRVPHTKYCILKILANFTTQIHLTLPRHNFINTTNKTYLDSVKKYISESLTNKFEEIPKILLDQCDCENDNNILEELKVNDKLFEFNATID